MSEIDILKQRLSVNNVGSFVFVSDKERSLNEESNIMCVINWGIGTWIFTWGWYYTELYQYTIVCNRWIRVRQFIKNHGLMHRKGGLIFYGKC